MKFDVEVKNAQAIIKKVDKFPAASKRAEQSAMKSVGFYGKTVLQNFLEYGISGHAPLHPLTAGFMTTKSGKFRKRSTPSIPLFRLGNFSRYVYNSRTNTVEIGLGKTRKAENGVLDPGLMGLLKKNEFGTRIPLSPAARVVMRKRLEAIGLPPLSRKTTHLTVPARPVMAPLFKKIGPIIPKLYNDRYNRAIERYMTGKDTRTSKIGL